MNPPSPIAILLVPSSSSQECHTHTHTQMHQRWPTTTRKRPMSPQRRPKRMTTHPPSEAGREVSDQPSKACTQRDAVAGLARRASEISLHAAHNLPVPRITTPSQPAGSRETSPDRHLRQPDSQKARQTDRHPPPLSSAHCRFPPSADQHLATKEQIIIRRPLHYETKFLTAVHGPAYS